MDSEGVGRSAGNDENRQTAQIHSCARFGLRANGWSGYRVGLAVAPSGTSEILMTTKLIAALVALALTTGTVAAQPAPKKADDQTLVTKVYDIKPLLGERGKANNITDADAVIK